MFGLAVVLQLEMMVFGWLDRNTVATEANDVSLLLQFPKRHSSLAKNLHILRKKGPIDVNA